MDIIFFCKMCKEDKKHMDLDWQPDDSPVRFKCFSCGEYNSPPSGNIRVFGEVGGVKHQSVAEEIMEPMEIVWKKLVRLSKESSDVAVNNQRVFDIAQEMDAALSVLRRDVEGILEPALPPDDIYKDYESEENIEVSASSWEPSILDLFTSRGEEK